MMISPAVQRAIPLHVGAPLAITVTLSSPEAAAICASAIRAVLFTAIAMVPLGSASVSRG